MKAVISKSEVKHTKIGIDHVFITSMHEEIFHDVLKDDFIEHIYDISFKCNPDISERAKKIIEDALVNTRQEKSTELYHEIFWSSHDELKEEGLNSISINILEKIDGEPFKTSYAYYEKGILKVVRFSDDYCSWMLTRNGKWEFSREKYWIKWNLKEIEYNFKTKPESLRMIPDAIDNNVQLCFMQARKYMKDFFGTDV